MRSAIPRPPAILLGLLALLVPLVITAPAAQAESHSIAWAVNAFGGGESGGSSFTVLVDGRAGTEPVVVDPGSRVALPQLVDGGTYDVSFRDTSTGDITGPVTVAPTTENTVDVAVHPTADGARTATAFVNAATAPSSGQRLLLRHGAATGEVSFQLYRGGAEGGASSPIGSAVTATNGTEVAYGSSVQPGITYTIEAVLPDGTRQEQTFTPSSESSTPRNQALYLTGRTTPPTTGGESGPFLLPVLATAGSGEGPSVGLYVVNGFSPGATETANSFTVKINGRVVGGSEASTVQPGARKPITAVTRGNTFDITLTNDAGVDVGTETVTIPERSSVDVVVYKEPGGATVTDQFDNSVLESPVEGTRVVLRTIAAFDEATFQLARGATDVGSAVTVPVGTQADYSTTLTTGRDYGIKVRLGTQSYAVEGFTAGGETGRAGVRAIYALGSDPGSGGEGGPVRTARVVEGPSANPLAVVNGFGPGATDGANAYDVRVDNLSTGITVDPSSRAVLTGYGDRGGTSTVSFVRPGTSTVVASLDVAVPTEGTVDVLVRPDGAGGVTASALTNDRAPTSGSDLVVRHGAAVGQVDVRLFEGGGESGGGLTLVAGPVTLDRGDGVQIASGLAAVPHTLRVTLSDGTRLSQSFTPGGESGGALQGAYLVGLGASSPTPATLLPVPIPVGTGTSSGSGSGSGGGSTGGSGGSDGAVFTEPFVDVPQDALFQDEIAWLFSNGITRGCNPPENDLFCPDDTVTRGQMAAFLDRALGLEASSDDVFVDDDTSIFEANIQALAAAEVTQGCNPPLNNRYCPEDPVTRGQMAAFLTRALDLPASSTDRFVDDDSSVFEADIQALAAAGITRGCNPPENDRFCPTDPVTREQMAAFLFRALG